MFRKLMLAIMALPFALFADAIGDAVDLSSNTWTTGGSANWYVQYGTTHDGSDAVQSGDISNNQTSWMQTTVEGPINVSFWWKVSSESGCDHLKFYIDDVEQYSISGDTSWSQKTYSLSAGNHTLKWSYSKDVSVSIGSDCGWVDQVVVSSYEEEWFYTVSDGEATVTGTSLTSEAITIPSTLCGYPVTSIGDEAFHDCSSLTSVTIPDSVTSIGGYAFSGCSSLTSVTIRDSVTSIGEYAFHGCSSLTSVTIPSSITNIMRYAFSGCSSLTSVTIPDSVTSIGKYAFNDCSSLNHITFLGNGVTIGDKAFNGCYNMMEVGLSQKSLDVTLPVLFDKFASVTNVTFVGVITNISNNAFDGCRSLTDLNLPNEVVRIGDAAFRGCTGLRNLVMRDNVKTIGIDACRNSGIGEITISSTLTNVLGDAFVGCSSLTNVFIKDMKAWCGVAFATRGSNPTGLHPEMNNLYTELLLNGEVIRNQLIIHSDINRLLGFNFVGNTNLTSVVIESGNTEISESAFRECVSLESVIMPEGLLSIGISAFEGCEKLNGITIPSSVVEIDDRAFLGCERLSNLTILETKDGIANSTRLGTRAFEDCDSLSTVLIPSRVSVLGSGLFRNCENLQAVYYLGEYAPIIEGGATDIYQNTPTTLLTYVVPNSTGWLDVTLQLPVRWPDSLNDGRGIRIMPEKKCKLTFVHNDGTDKQAEIQLVAGSLIGSGKLPELTRNGYSFEGWFTSLEGGALVSENSVVTANVTLYAHWTLLPVYKVTFDCNGGTVSSVTREVVSGSEIGTLPIPTRNGYSFEGWFTSLERGALVSENSVVTANVTLYAHWTLLPVYKVTFDCNGGTVSSVTREVVSGSEIGTLPIPTRNGYTFNGWYTLKTEGSKVDAFWVVSSDVTLYAHWTQNTPNPEPVPEPTPNPMPTPTPNPVPGPMPEPELGEGDYEVGGEMSDTSIPENAASVYDGYVYSGNKVVGTIQAKIAKPKNDIAKVTAAIQIIGEKKVSVKGELDVASGELKAFAKDGRELKLNFGYDGMKGSFGAYEIDGVRNLFSSKVKEEKSDAENILTPWLGALNMKCPEGVLSVTIAKKGKVTVKGTYDGAKVSAKAQALVGEKWICIPVAYSKSGVNLAFTLWLDKETKSVEVVGLDGDPKVGMPGKLKAGAVFNIDEDILPEDILADIDTGNDATLNLLPIGESVSVNDSGKKWVVAGGAKAAKVTYKKGELTIAPGKRGQEIANASGLKLTYKAKDGSFKGSFTAYAIEKGKLKKHKATVEGVLINGIGYGTATIKKVGTWAVTIE